VWLIYVARPTVDNQGLLGSDHTYCVYMMANDRRNVIYTGVTGQLKVRAFQHRTGSVRGFTKSYNVKRLVYFEVTSDVYSAITREKQIKAGSRAKKIALIESMNPNWDDLYDTI
jgi:predicted GIY-YIG superfamily endonuclease